jgi:hypothetical protein
MNRIGFISSQIFHATLLLCASTLLLAPGVFSQQDTAASFTIRFADGINKFRVGEVIPIELAFSASVNETYQMGTATYDRSGRLGTEQFHVSPQGRDPLHNYYEGGVFGGFVGGGLSSGPRYLTSEPQTMRKELNEWMALDMPGHYTLYVTSGRVSRLDDGKPASVPLTSNTLTFDVVAADPAWQEHASNSAIAALDGDFATAEEKYSATRTLRFMDSPQSIHELVLQLAKPGGGSRWDFVAGLVGSSHQELVKQTLELELGSPETAITPDYILTLALASFFLSHDAPPPYPQTDKSSQDAWQKKMAERRKQFGDLEDHLYEKTASLLAAKQGGARAETIHTLVLRPAPESSKPQPLPGLSDFDVASAFRGLAPQQQLDVLRFYWPRFDVPAMANALEDVLDTPILPISELRNFAFQRLTELNPKAAEPRILSEIQHPHLDGGIFPVSGESLSGLAATSLPALEDMLVTRVEQQGSRTKELDAQLISRYATTPVLPRVKAIYQAQRGDVSCKFDDGLLTYLLRTDPDYAIKNVRHLNLCLPNTVRTIAQMKRWPEVEPLVIADMNDPNLWSARQYAETLAKYGGPIAEQAIWQRLRAFHKQWADRESELTYRPNMPRDANDAMSFEFGVVEALGHAQGWLLSNDQITELESITLGNERESVAHWHWKSPVDLQLIPMGNGAVRAILNNAQFSDDDTSLLCAKLAQYPAGTHFVLNTFGRDKELATVIQAIDETALQHGLIIDLPPTQ